MRALDEAQTKTLFDKLAQYCGTSLKELIAPIDDSGDRFVFRLQKQRVYYVRLSIANLAVSVARDKLLSLGISVGKFTKSGKFKVAVTFLPVLAEHARYKVWIKPNGEMPFLYGGNILKAHIGRWTEDTPEHQGIVVFSMDDKPLGFGVTSRSTSSAKSLDPTAVVVFNQADCGSYLRDEDTLFATG